MVLAIKAIGAVFFILLGVFVAAIFWMEWE
jgi:hypothetical protein